MVEIVSAVGKMFIFTEVYSLAKFLCAISISKLSVRKLLITLYYKKNKKKRLLITL